MEEKGKRKEALVLSLGWGRLAEADHFLLL